jgi:magnesium-transporting ATPase (P-type)
MKFTNFAVENTAYEIERDRNEILQMLAPPHPDRKLYRFFESLCVCHTVIREKDGTYRAESPDELALLKGTHELGCALNERSSSSVIITVREYG